MTAITTVTNINIWSLPFFAQKEVSQTIKPTCNVLHDTNLKCTWKCFVSYRQQHLYVLSTVSTAKLLKIRRWSDAT